MRGLLLQPGISPRLFNLLIPSHYQILAIKFLGEKRTITLKQDDAYPDSVIIRKLS